MDILSFNVHRSLRQFLGSYFADEEAGVLRSEGDIRYSTTPGILIKPQI